MALEGSFKTNDYNGRYLLFTWVATQDISNNSSTITWVLRGGGKAKYSYYTSGNFKLVIDGETVYSSAARINLGENTVVASGTKKIYHYADGTRSFTASAEAGIYTVAVNCTGSGSFALDNIPRGATLLTAPNFNDEQNPTITYSNPIGNAATTLQACIGNGTNIKIWKDLNKTGTSYTFNFTEAERAVLRDLVEYGSTTTLTMHIITTIGSEMLYSTRNFQFTILNGTPLINPTAVDTGQVSVTLTGDINTMIKDYNVIKCAVNPTARKGATIVSTSITCDGKTINGSNGTFSYVNSNQFTFTATDSRRNTVTQVITLPMVEYVKPSCSIEAELTLNTNDNTKVNISFKLRGVWYNGNFGQKQNKLTLSWRLLNGSNTVATNGTITLDTPGETDLFESYIEEYAIPIDFDYKGSYTVVCDVEDLTTDPITVTSKVLKALPVFDWGENDFNFNVPVKINGVEIDYIVEQGTKNGWSYRKWNSGKGECWKILTVNMAVDRAWGSLYISDSISRQNYPFPFINKPVENVTIQGNAPVWIITGSNGNGVNGAYASAMYHLMSPGSAASAEHYISYYCIGNWR